ncbi:MAG: hypothetical protein IPL79_03945 [Myxococcales bacterium]|nr:hypothetical protein [Myxococcales bacterium]
MTNMRSASQMQNLYRVRLVLLLGAAISVACSNKQNGKISNAGEAEAGSPVIATTKADNESGDQLMVATPGAAPVVATTKAPTGCSEVDCMLAEKPLACCTKYRRSAGSRPAASTSGPHEDLDRAETQSGRSRPAASTTELDEDLDMAAFHSGVSSVKARLTSCSAKSSARGKINVRVKIGGDGRVSSTTVLGSFDDAVGSCVAAALQTATFKKTQNGGQFDLPIAF